MENCRPGGGRDPGFKKALVTLPLLFSVLIIVSMCLADHVYLKNSVWPTVQEKIQLYDMVPVGIEQNREAAQSSFFNFVNGSWSGNYEHSSAFNIIYLLALLTLLWSFGMLALVFKKRKNDKTRLL